MSDREQPVVPIKAGNDGKPCDCYELRVRGGGHSGSCIRHLDRFVQVTVDGAPCLIGYGDNGMAAVVASAIGAGRSSVRTVRVDEDYYRGGALVTVEIFAPYTEEVRRGE